MTGVFDDMQLMVLLLLEYGAKSRVRRFNVDDVLSFIMRGTRIGAEVSQFLSLRKASSQSLLQSNVAFFEVRLCSSLGIHAVLHEDPVTGRQATEFLDFRDTHWPWPKVIAATLPRLHSIP